MSSPLVTHAGPIAMAFAGLVAGWYLVWGWAAAPEIGPPWPGISVRNVRPLRREGPGPRDRFGDLLPQAAVARIGSMLLRHGRSISRIAYSPDGSMLASSGNGVIRIWDASTGRELHHLEGSDCFALSPDWKIVASSILDTPGATETRRLVLREAASGREIRRS